jgi:hypothetical protein
MFEVNVLEYGYSFESKRHFIKFLIKGLDKKNEEKLVGIISQIPEGDYKRFSTVSTENGLNILELFPLKEYPFSSEVPNAEEVKSVEDTVKGFLGQFSG